MAAIVVPFRGAGGKERLEPLPAEAREKLALAMLGDVLAACVVVGPTVVVTADEAGAGLSKELGARTIGDPGGGQGAAVAAALTEFNGDTALVVNADVPCVVPHDLRVLAAAAPPGGFAFVQAADGTTNALSLPDPTIFRPLYGPGSAARFRTHAPFATLAIPALAEDVDTQADLERLAPFSGPRTRALVAVHA